MTTFRSSELIYLVHSMCFLPGFPVYLSFILAGSFKVFRYVDQNCSTVSRDTRKRQDLFYAPPDLLSFAVSRSLTMLS